jgi:AraC-like DNA-binding protein/tetratricopeptide (TPR) repeat protein
MVSHDAKSAPFHQAAEPTLKRIRRDRERLSPRAAPLVAFIEEHLFEPDLDLRLRKRVDALADDVGRELYQVLGASPREYARQRRLDVAERLFRGTRWKVWEVSAATGWKSPKQLAKQFKRRTGLSPSQVWPEPAAGESEAPRGQASEQSVRLEVQAVYGAVEPPGMVALVQRIRALYPAPPRQMPPSRPAVKLSTSGHRREEETAARTWAVVRDMPAEQMRRALCQRLRFGSPALFRLLGEKGREIGRRDRKRGVALVELGVEVLEANADAFGESVHDLLTVGWSWTANQRRFALDHSGGEEALGFARQEWEMPRASRDSQAEAELHLIEGTFRLFQRRFDEARNALTLSIELSRQTRRPDTLVKALLQRVELARHVDDPQLAADDLHEVLGVMADREEQPYLMLSIYTSLIALYMRLDRLEEVIPLFDAAEPMAKSVDSPLINAQLLWLKGLVCKRRSDLEAAESLLSDAHHVLISKGETCHAAVLALDLMELFVEKGLTVKARNLAIETIAVLQTLKLHREILAAMKLLRSALESDGLDLIVLDKVRKSLRSLKKFSIG